MKGQRQKRGDERRQQLLDAALELFAERGFRGTTLADVARRVGISPPGVLHHFATKEALLAAVIEHFDATQRDGWDDLTAIGGLEALRRLPAMADNVLGDAAFNRLMSALSVEKTGEPFVRDYFRARYRLARRWLVHLMEKGQARGEIRMDVDLAAKAVQILAIQDGVTNQRRLDPSAVQIAAVYSDFIESLIESIQAPCDATLASATNAF